MLLFSNKNEVGTTELDLQGKISSTFTFDMLVVLLSYWFLVGLFWDGWSHIHNLPETFFTPSHLLLYSGFGATAFLVVLSTIIGRKRGLSLFSAVPKGYEWSLVGIILFATAGGIDMMWHEIFGIEADLEALLSPPHLLLALGAGMLVTGPIRATAMRYLTEDKQGWQTLGPLIFASAGLLSWLTFFTMFMNPFTFGYAISAVSSPEDVSSLQVGAASILFYGVLLTGILLVILARFSMPLGGFTAIIGINSILMAYLQDRYFMILIGILAGILLDIAFYIAKHTLHKDTIIRMFGGLIPFTFFAFYAIIIAVFDSIAVAETLLFGIILLSAIFGFLSSYLVATPPKNVSTVG
ncbi:MAG TPA: hypothetical protein VJ044_17185 [Candidatus Hodarchaeales archaeon]|nr:hypothetical protein [Candidatus Hodarchaeales archaeon]